MPQLVPWVIVLTVFAPPEIATTQRNNNVPQTTIAPQANLAFLVSARKMKTIKTITTITMIITTMIVKDVMMDSLVTAAMPLVTVAMAYA